MTGEITGVVLAGGRGRRMGGGDKGLLAVGGGVMAQVAAGRLLSQTGAVVINANRNIAEYEKLGYAVVADSSVSLPAAEAEEFAGPLAGILAGLRVVESEWALFVPCDSPFFPQTLARDLMRGAADKRADVAVAFAGGRAQPVFMLARRALADDLAKFVADGGRKIDLWYARHKHAEVMFENAGDFANINTPEDLAEANKRLQQ